LNVETDIPKLQLPTSIPRSLSHTTGSTELATYIITFTTCHLAHVT